MERALSNTGSLYCMAHCERLSSAAYDEIEAKLAKLTDKRDSKYGLVFLYAEEASNARIKSCLGNYLVNSASITEPEILQEYIRNQILRGEDDEENGHRYFKLIKVIRKTAGCFCCCVQKLWNKDITSAW